MMKMNMKGASAAGLQIEGQPGYGAPPEACNDGDASYERGASHAKPGAENR